MFKNGDLVLCINNSSINEFPSWVSFFPNFKNIIKVGRMYTIRSIINGFNNNSTCVRLEEIICPIHPFYNIECGWGSYRFRKIEPKETKINTNEKIKAEV